MYRKKTISNKLLNIHKQLKLKFGRFTRELPEQEAIAKLLPSNAKVLEFGGNIGRASLVINYLLEKKYKGNHLVIESDFLIANKLKINKVINNAKFKIYNGAISKVPLIQRGWITKACTNNKEKGWKDIPYIT